MGDRRDLEQENQNKTEKQDELGASCGTTQEVLKKPLGHFKRTEGTTENIS